MGSDRNRWWRRAALPGAGPSVLAVCLAAGLVLAFWQPLEARDLLALGQRFADHPATLPLVLLAMAGLFVFALPGSLGFWLVAPFQPLPVAVIGLVLASLAGGLGAYRFAGRLSGEPPGGSRARRVVSQLQERGDFLILCALRIFPGFPHSVVNYASGIVRIPLARFIASTVIGLAVKFSVYTVAVQAGIQAIERGDMLSPLTALPLLVLALLMIGGAWLRRRIDSSARD